MEDTLYFLVAVAAGFAIGGTMNWTAGRVLIRYGSTWGAFYRAVGLSCLLMASAFAVAAVVVGVL